MPKIKNPASPSRPCAPRAGSAPRRVGTTKHLLARLEHRRERLVEPLLDRLLANGHRSVPFPEHLARVPVERVVQVLRDARNGEVAPRLLDQAARNVGRTTEVPGDRVRV